MIADVELILERSTLLLKDSYNYVSFIAMYLSMVLGVL